MRVVICLPSLVRRPSELGIRVTNPKPVNGRPGYSNLPHISSSPLLPTMSTIAPYATTLLVAFWLFVAYKLLRIGRRDPRLPPGPPAVPVLGNAHLIPTTGIGLK
jgi:hypothetical protein